MLLRAVWRGARRLAIRLLRRSGASAAPRVAFHERFLRLVARRGFAREANQTSLELAAEVEHRLAHAATGQAAQTAPRRIVEAFYQVRFGDRPLDRRQLAAVEKALADLEAGLAERPATR